MRIYNATGYPWLAAALGTLLVLNLPAPAMATTEQPAGPAAATSANAVPVPAASSAAEPLTASAATAAAPDKPKPLPPTLIARINLTTQTMVVQAGGKTVHTWKVSSGAPGYATPPGTFKPGWMAKMWHSRQYDDAPMPYSVFFNSGIAVHGTMNPGSLGRAASHGCVRLATSNAERFYGLVARHGMAQTRIIVHGAQPFSRNEAVAARARTNRHGSRASRWTYASSSTTAHLAPSRSGAHSRDTYGYVPAKPPRRISSVRAPYWSR